jgi:hypothetical protein
MEPLLPPNESKEEVQLDIVEEYPDEDDDTCNSEEEVDFEGELEEEEKQSVNEESRGEVDSLQPPTQQEEDKIEGVGAPEDLELKRQGIEQKVEKIVEYSSDRGEGNLEEEKESERQEEEKKEQGKNTKKRNSISSLEYVDRIIEQKSKEVIREIRKLEIKQQREIMEMVKKRNTYKPSPRKLYHIPSKKNIFSDQDTEGIIPENYGDILALDPEDNGEIYEEELGQEGNLEKGESPEVEQERSVAQSSNSPIVPPLFKDSATLISVLRRPSSGEKKTSR